MNLTITADEKLIERARDYARAQGTSLQALLRRYLETLAGETPLDSVAAELTGLMKEQGGRSSGPIRREDAYEGRL
jgi:hypothetical protein